MPTLIQANAAFWQGIMSMYAFPMNLMGIFWRGGL